MQKGNLERRGANDDEGDDEGAGEDNGNPLPTTIPGNMDRKTKDHNSHKDIDNIILPAPLLLQALHFHECCNSLRPLSRYPHPLCI